MPGPSRKTKSFNKTTALQKYDPKNYYNATLTGNSDKLTAHTKFIPGNPTLTGDTLIGNAKNSKQTLVGGAGNDSLVALGKNTYLLSGTGNETLVGSASYRSTLVGGSGTNSLFSAGASNSLVGGAGSSTLTATGSKDTLVGGSGSSTLTATGASSSLLAGTGNSSSLYAAGAGSTLSGPSYLFFKGSDTLVASGANDSIFGGYGNNSLYASGASDTLAANNAINFSGLTTLVAAGTADSLFGGSGQSSLYASGSGDTLQGGSGSSTIVAAGTADFAIGGSGVTSFTALGTNNTLRGGSGSSNFSDTVSASGNFFAGGSGTTVITVQGSNSTLIAGSGVSTLVASGSLDSLVASASSLTSGSLSASGNHDTLVGGAGLSTLFSSGSFNSLIGGSGISSLYSTGLSNTLVAGTGLSVLTGGTISTPLLSSSPIGSPTLVVSSLSGFNVGEFLSGPGIPQGTQILSITTSGNLLSLSLSNTLTASIPAGTQIQGTNSETLLGATATDNATLVGNGHSSLVGLGGNNLYILTNPGDTITESTNGSSVLITGAYSTLQSSFALNAIVPNFYANVTLSGTSLSGTGHTTLASTGGDLLTATGNFVTLTGGSGHDTLVALGNSGYLAAGSTSDTLLGTTIRGASETLSGNGLSSLVGRGGNDLLNLNQSGDQITAPFSGLRINSSANLNLGAVDSLHYYTATLTGNGTSGSTHQTTLIPGSNTQNISGNQLSGDTLTTSVNAVTLTGGAGNDSLAASGNNDVLYGGSGNNTLTALGSGTDTLLGSTLSTASSTFVGNGHSSLVAQGSNDLFLLGTQGDTLSFLNPTLSGDKISAAFGAQLDTLVAGHYSQVTLTGNFTSGLAHTSTIGGQFSVKNATLPVTGDTLVATGDKITLLGGAGNDSLVALGNNDSLVSGSASDTLLGSTLAGAYETLIGNGRSSLVGRGANDTFILNSSGDTLGAVGGGTGTIQTSLNTFSLSDTLDYGPGVANVKNLIFTGLGNTTLVGNNLANSIQGGSGFNSLVAVGSGNSTLDASKSSGSTLVGNGASTLLGGSGNNLYVLNHSGDKIIESANGGIDTVSLTGAFSAYNMNDAGTNGSGILNVENLVYSGTASAQLYGNTLSNDIVGGSGNNLLTGGGGYGVDTLDASASKGNNTLLGSALVGGSLIGGSGTNTFYLNNSNDTITAAPGSINNIFTTASQVDLSQNFGSVKVHSLGYTGAGITKLIGNSLGGNTLTAGIASVATLGDGGGATDYLSGATAGPNLFQVASLGAGADTVIGGSKTDTLQLTSQATLTDAAFSTSYISSVEVLKLTSNSSITLGINAATEGLSTIVAGTGSDTVNAATMPKNLVLNASASSAAFLTGGTGNDLFEISSSALAASTINGTSGIDTLQILNGAVTLNSLSTGISNINVLSLSGGFNNISGLGASGVTLIAGSTLGGDILDVSSWTKNIFVTASTAVLGDTLIASAASNSTLVGGAGGDSIMVTATQLVGDSLVGGAGTDTLQITTAGTLGDSAFVNDLSAGIEVLNLTSNSSVTLGANAAKAGFSTLVAGTGSDTINASSFKSRGLIVDATANTSKFNYTGTNQGDQILINSAAITSSTITGGAGVDTLQFSNSPVTLSSFSGITNVEVLTLSGGNNNISGLGSSGITLLGGGINGGDTLDASTSTSNILVNASFAFSGDTLIASSTKNSTLLGSAFFGNSFTVSTEQLLQNDSIIGGFATDTLIYGGSALASNDFFKSSGGRLDILSLTGSGNGSFVLGTDANAAGINTLISDSIGGDTLNASAYTNGSILINASTAAKSDTLIGAGSVPTTLIGSQVNGVGSAFYLPSISLSNSNPSSIAVTGNISAQDTLALTTGGQTFQDFLIGASINSLEVLSLSGGNNTVVLGPNSQSQGLNTVIGGTGPDFLSASGQQLGNVWIDGSHSSLGDTLVAGTGTSRATLIGSNLATATNTFQITDASLLGNDSLVSGAASKDILQVNSGSQNIADSYFSKLTSFEGLSLSGNSSVTLGSNAMNAGFATISGGFGNDTITQLATDTNALTIVGGTGTNLFSLANTSLLGNDSIVGGSGIDTLSFAAAGTLSDTGFGKDRGAGIEVLSLASNSSVTLGANAASAGFSTIVAGTGSDTINAAAFNTGKLFIDATANTSKFNYTATNFGDLILINSATAATSSITGGTGVDTLQFSNSPVTLSSFSGISSVEVLTLSGGNNNISGLGSSGLTLLGGGSNGGDTLDASTATSNILVNASSAFLGDTLIASTTKNSTLLGGSGNDSLSVTATQLAGDSIYGGFGSDTLQITTSGTLSDAAFGNERGAGIEVLKLTSNSAVTLGANAGAAGFSTIVAGTGSDTINAATLNSGSLTIDASANTSKFNYAATYFGDLILFNSAAAGTSTITGGTGVDTVQLSNSPVNVSSFGWFSSVEVLSLSGGNNNISGLGSSGITLLGGGINGGDTLDATTSTSNILVNGSNAAAGDTLIASAVNGVSSTLLGARNASNTFKVATESALQLDSLSGGNKVDTLVYGGSALATGDFSLSAGGSLDLLSLAGSGNGSFVLGTDAGTAGISTLIGDSIGGDTLDASAYNGGSIVINASTAAKTDTLIGAGSAPTTLIGSQVNGISNAFYLSSTNLFNSIAVTGNSSAADTLALTTGAQNFQDSLIGANIKSVEVLSLSGGNNTVVVGTNTQANGLSTVIGGTGPDFLSASAQTLGTIWIDGSHSSLGDTLVAGAGTSKATLIGNALASATNTFQIANASLLGNDSLVSGAASKDILQVTAVSQTVSDSYFSKLANFESLSLPAASAVTLGANAKTAGFGSIFGGNGGNDTFTQTSADTNALTLVGGNGTNLFSIDNSVFGNDSILGNGADTLALTSQVINLNDGFSRISGINVLDLSSTGSTLGNTVTLGSLAQAAGIRTVIAGQGDSLVASAYTADITFDGSLVANPVANKTLTLVGGTGNDLFKIKNNNILSVSSLVGGGGSDTVQFTEDGLSITDNGFSKLQQIKSLLTANGTNYIQLGAIAGSSGISSVYSGTGNDTIDASSFNGASATTAPIYLNAGNGNNLILLGTAVGSTTNATITAGGGADNIDASNFNGASITINAGDANNIVKLGTTVGSTTIASITTGAGADNIDASGFNGSSLSIDAGNGNNVVTGSDTSKNNLTSGTGNTIFNLKDQSAAANSTITGGLGIDTLQFSAATTLIDSNLANTTGIDFLKASPSTAASFVLGPNAQAAGIRSIFGSSGNDTFDVSAYTLGATLNGGLGNDKFVLRNGQLLSQSTVTGGSGNDTLAFSTDALSVTDTAFAHVTSVKAVQTANGNNIVVLAANANAAGINSLIGGIGSDTLDASQDAHVVTLDGGGRNNIGIDYLGGSTLPAAPADNFVLADASGSYYATSTLLPATNGNYAVVQNFTASDALILSQTQASGTFGNWLGNYDLYNSGANVPVGCDYGLYLTDATHHDSLVAGIATSGIVNNINYQLV